MAAPEGAVVSIYYDSEIEIRVGDVLRTTTGRLYLTIRARKQEGGMHKGRQHLRSMVVKEAPIDAKIYPIRWYPRSRRSHG